MPITRVPTRARHRTAPPPLPAPEEAVTTPDVPSPDPDPVLTAQETPSPVVSAPPPVPAPVPASAPDIMTIPADKRRVKRTFTLSHAVIADLNDLQILRFRRTGRKPDLSDMVEYAIRLLLAEDAAQHPPR